MFNKASKFSGGFTKVYTPSITSPTTNQIVGSTTPTITASAFSSYGRVTHSSTDWQVSDALDFNTIRWSSLDNSTNKTTITASDLQGGDRYVRVRYKASNGTYSDWSTPILFTSPWGSGSNSTLISSTSMEINASSTITFQPGTYRVTIWGGGGGGATKVTSGGGAGSVTKTVLYTTATSVAFTIGNGGTGATGSADSGTNVAGTGGSPGGGNGANGGGSSWNGGGGGGYSIVTLGGVSMTAAGGGGGAGDVGSSGTAGGSDTGAGGTGGNGSGSSGTSGGGGGGARNNPNQGSGTGGKGGSNGGSYTNGYSGSGTTPGNSYYSSTYGRTFGEGGSAGGGNGKNGGALIEKIPAQNVPVVSITSNISTTFTQTAGSSNDFSITATDTANNDSTVTYQWYLSTNGGSSYSAISGATSSTLTRYNPFYYSDNGHKIYCRATVTNSAGTNSTDSNICTFTVNRNYDCNPTPVTGTVVISAAGLKPSAVGGDSEWGSWSPGFSDICNINGSTQSFNAGSRCDVGCKINGVFQGYDMQLELQIVRSTDNTKQHYGSQSGGSNSCGRNSNFQISANGGGWEPETMGTPTFKLVLIDSGTQCRNGAGDIAAESDQAALNYTYNRRRYYYETRP